MRKLVPALAVTFLAIGALAVAPATASTPEDSGTLTPSMTAGVVTKTWSGTIAGANPFNDCAQGLDDSLNDHHTFKISLPAGFYSGRRHVTLAVTTLADAADAILTINRDGKSVSSSDGGGAGGGESFAITDPKSASYDAITCSFAGASPYNAVVTLTTSIGDAKPVLGGTSTTAPSSTYGNYDLAKLTGPDDSANRPSASTGPTATSTTSRTRRP